MSPLRTRPKRTPLLRLERPRGPLRQSHGAARREVTARHWQRLPDSEAHRTGTPGDAVQTRPVRLRRIALLGPGLAVLHDALAAIATSVRDPDNLVDEEDQREPIGGMLVEV